MFLGTVYLKHWCHWTLPSCLEPGQLFLSSSQAAGKRFHPQIKLWPHKTRSAFCTNMEMTQSFACSPEQVSNKESRCQLDARCFSERHASHWSTASEWLHCSCCSHCDVVQSGDSGNSFCTAPYEWDWRQPTWPVGCQACVGIDSWSLVLLFFPSLPLSGSSSDDIAFCSHQLWETF